MTTLAVYDMGNKKVSDLEVDDRIIGQEDYGPSIGMPTLPQPEVQRWRERGYTGIDREEFDPPSKDAYQAPQALREKVLEAMKEEIPSQYLRGVERYFKGLTE